MQNSTINSFANNTLPLSNDGTSYYFDKERIPVNFSKLLPGYFYTFVSVTIRNESDIPTLDEYQINKSASPKPYFDRRPIFLSLGQEGPMEVGLNVKLMPIRVRRWFLSKYLKLILPILEKMEDSSGNLVDFGDRIKMKENSFFYKINRHFITEVGEQNNINLKFLIDKYTRGEMSNPLALIDWEQVPKLCNFTYVNDGSIISKTPISYFLTKFT